MESLVGDFQVEADSFGAPGWYLRLSLAGKPPKSRGLHLHPIHLRGLAMENRIHRWAAIFAVA